jgi:hypothetical protein
MCCKCQLAALNASRVVADDIHWALVNKDSCLLAIVVFGTALGVCCSIAGFVVSTMNGILAFLVVREPSTVFVTDRMRRLIKLVFIEVVFG